jgi:hypothetical protein
MTDAPQSYSAVLDHVFVVGGTHGNEAIGVQLAKQYHRERDAIRARHQFDFDVLLANTSAIAANRRYCGMHASDPYHHYIVVKATIDGGRTESSLSDVHQRPISIGAS